MAEQKKQSFLHGAMFLTVATVLVKIIGALYKIPLNAIIGERGFSYFNTAYNIYAVLLVISTAGLPVALSRSVSTASSLGHYGQVRRILRTSQLIFVTIGAIGSLLMTVFCHQDRAT
jgi:stage V sporulation protein B